MTIAEVVRFLKSAKRTAADNGWESEVTRLHTPEGSSHVLIYFTSRRGLGAQRGRWFDLNDSAVTAESELTLLVADFTRIAAWAASA